MRKPAERVPVNYSVPSKGRRIDLDTSMASAGGSSSSGRVLRTIYFPNEQADVLLNTAATLQKQLEDLRKLSDERIAALELSARERADAAERRFQADGERISSLEKRLGEREKSLRMSCNDYLTLRRESKMNERRLTEANERLRAENAALKKELGHEKGLAHHTGAAAVEHFRSQSTMREQELTVLRNKHEHANRTHNDTLSKLREKHSRLLRRYKQLDQRRQFDFEGFSNDVAAMRRKVRRLETLFLGKAVPSDRLVENGAPGFAHALDARVMETPEKRNVLESELKGLRERLASLEVDLLHQ